MVVYENLLCYNILMKSLFSIAFLLAIFTPVNALPKYTITAVFNPTTKTITGKMQITFTNTSSTALKEIKILNFPHSYKEESTSLTEVNFEQLYPEKFNPGFMDITVKDQKESLQYEKPYQASISLVEPLKPHEEISIALFFNVQIPEKFGIFGSYKDTFNLTAQWYPNLCSLENSGWNCKAPPDTSSFTIDLSLPEHYTTILTELCTALSFG